MTFRTRAKLAAVFAVLGLLVWADARTQECPAPATSTARPDRSSEVADHGVSCPGR